MMHRHTVRTPAAMLITLIGVAVVQAAKPSEGVLYRCDFEGDTGIFRLDVKGPGFEAQVDESVSHGGRQSVKLTDAGGADIDLSWMEVWDRWAQKSGKASLQWARHWDPDRPIRLRRGCTYEVRAYVKTRDAYALGMRIDVWGRNGSPVRGDTRRFSPIVRGTQNWRWISARVACTAGDGELGSIAIALLGKGTAWVDDVTVIEYRRNEPESINAGRYPPMQFEAVHVETASCLALEFIGDLDCAQAEKPENWAIESDDDPAFRSGIRPAKIGRIRQLDNPDGSLWWNDTYRHTIFLLLSQPLSSGYRYRIVLQNAGIERQEYPLAYDERSSLSRAIKANQVGYLPGARKYAYLGDWLGSAGHLPLDDTATEFTLVDARTVRTVFSGTLKLRMRHDRKEPFSTSALGNVTGEDVYDLDFSSFSTPGEYYLVVPGVGRSRTFGIAGDVYREPFYHCARAILHQRCGIEMKEPYSEFRRGPCHRGPAMEIEATIVEHGSEDQDKLMKANAAIKTGQVLDVWGGYHDAADYDRLIGHVRIPAVLLTLYEMFPQNFSDGQLDSPESGNGLPDLVDEARWGVDFWVRMQDADDGGVRGGAGPNAAVSAPADRDANPIYVYGKDPISSLSLAAVAAQLARVLEGLGDKQDAAFYLERAEKAWAYGVNHGGEKFRIASALAAIELFKATNDPKYHEAFLKCEPTRFDTVQQERHQGHFAWNVWTSYATCRQTGIDRKIRAACVDRILDAANREIEALDRFAYRMPYTGVGGPPFRYGWGCGTNFFSGGDFCILAWRLTGDENYRDAALLAADFSLGCHPTGTVFVTGLGQRHVHWAMHTLSSPMAVQVGAPVRQTLPGIPLFGTHAYPRGFGGWQSQLLYAYTNPSVGRDNFYPPCKTWPDLRLFADVGWLPILSEFSVSSTMLHTVFLYGALLEESLPSSDDPATSQPIVQEGAPTGP